MISRDPNSDANVLDPFVPSSLLLAPRDAIPSLGEEPTFLIPFSPIRVALFFFSAPFPASFPSAVDSASGDIFPFPKMGPTIYSPRSKGDRRGCVETRG